MRGYQSSLVEREIYHTNLLIVAIQHMKKIRKLSVLLVNESLQFMHLIVVMSQKSDLIDVFQVIGAIKSE